MDELLAELRATQADATAFSDADTRLHAAIVDAGGSRALRVMHDALGDLLRASRARTSPDPAVRAGSLARLEQLVQAIHEGDARAAERAMRTHLRDVSAAQWSRRAEGVSGRAGAVRPSAVRPPRVT